MHSDSSLTCTHVSKTMKHSGGGGGAIYAVNTTVHDLTTDNSEAKDYCVTESVLVTAE